MSGTGASCSGGGQRAHRRAEGGRIEIFLHNLHDLVSELKKMARSLPRKTLIRGCAHPPCSPAQGGAHYACTGAALYSKKLLCCVFCACSTAPLWPVTPQPHTLQRRVKPCRSQ